MNNSSNKHPASLRVFFATEMWERYGFYIVQSLLALYMAMHFQWPDSQVYMLVGSFTALTYLSPIIGGWIADKLLGQKRSIILGAIFLLISYLLLYWVKTTIGLEIALAGVAVGTGLLKPNISSLLGNEYPVNSPKRESGFTIFYMGITTGIILGTTLPNYINNHFGWSGAFLSAAFGIIIALFVFTLGVKRYQIADYNPLEIKSSNYIKALSIIASLWSTAFLVLNYPVFADILFILAAIVSVAYMIYVIKHEPLQQSRQTMVIGFLCLISVMFWAFNFQMFLSLTLFIARVVEPTFLGISFPPPYYVCIQSIGMLVFGFFLAKKSPASNITESGLRTVNKFLLSMVFMCFTYGLITLISSASTSDNLLAAWYFIPAYLLISIAELLLSPVGLSAVTVLASRHKVSTMMGIFFVSLGMGAHLSGKLASITSVNLGAISIGALKAHYAHGFGILFLILLAATCCCGIINLIVRSLLTKNTAVH